MIKLLFPTYLLEEQLTGEVLDNVTSELDLLLENLKFNLDPEDDTGKLLISEEGIKRSNNVISRYNLKYLDREIQRCANMYLKETNTIPATEFKTFIAVMTSLLPGADSTKHMHRPDCLVVVYYHRVPENGGNIRLFSPIQYKEFQKETVIDITPTVGKILVFPGWLFHEVLKNNSDSIRYSIAITMQVYEDLSTE